MKAIFFLLLALVLTSCATTPPNSGTAEEVTKILKTVQQSVEDVKSKQDELVNAQIARQAKVQETLQFISDRIYVALYVNDQDPAKTSYNELIKSNLDTTQKVLPPASADVKMEAIQDLQQKLSKERKDKDELELRYKTLEQKANDLKSDTDKLTLTVSDKTARLNDATKAANDSVRQLSSKEEEIKLKSKEADEARNIANQEQASKTRLKIASGFMCVGGVIIAAAVVATLMHVGGVLLPGIVAGSCLLIVGWLITYVEQLLQKPWFQYTIGGILLGGLGLLGYIVYRSTKQRKVAMFNEKISTRSIGALQDAKNDDQKLGTNKFGAIAPYLNEWHQTSDGKPDVAVQNEIDRRLVAMNLKATNPVPAATLPALPA